jgi:hypothetical protein
MASRSLRAMMLGVDSRSTGAMNLPWLMLVSDLAAIVRL